MEQKQYLCIDQKSFYATVECVARGLDPMTADLVVADPERSENTICLAVSAHLKKRGVKNRCRIKEIPPHVKPIIASPRMQLYIDCSAAIYGVFLKYLAPEDIYVYSIDESFLDVTPYLKMYMLTEIGLMAMIIGANNELNVGPGRAGFYLAEVLDVKMQIANEIVKDDDPELLYTKCHLAKRMKQIMGKENWLRYRELFPLLKEYWEW